MSFGVVASIALMGWQTGLLFAGAVLLLCLVLRDKFAGRAEPGGNET